MATGLAGLYGVSPQSQELAAHKAGPADRGHSIPGTSHRQPQGKDAAGPYPPTLPPAGTLEGLPGGAASDRTPRTHAGPAAPWAQMPAPEAQRFSGVFHSLRFAISRHLRHVPSSEMTRVLDFAQTPGDSVLAGAVPGQLRTGSKDVAQGRGRPNDYGFGLAHLLAYHSIGRVPTAYTGSAERGVRLQPGQGLTQSVNVDSRYAAGGTVRAVGPGQIQGLPTPYVQPPNPTISPSTGYGRESGFTYGG